MGSASSKATHRLLRTTGSRVPPATAEPARPRSERPLAFENKNEAIKQDAKDPHFMEKLNRLGPVSVDHHMQTIRTASDARNMYQSRMRSEAEAARPQSTQNRLLASSLVELLEERKSVTDRAGLETLTRRYHIDVAKLEQIARVVNTPSTDESTAVQTTDQHGKESLTVTARWIDPVPSHA